MDIITPMYNTTRTYAPLSPGIACASPVDQGAMREYPVQAPPPYGVRDPGVARQPVAPVATMNGTGSSQLGYQGFRTIYQG